MMAVLSLALTATALATTAPAYDADIAQRSLYYSKISYCDHADRVVNGTCVACKHRPDFKGMSIVTATDDTQALVGYDDGDFVVVFRGSHNVENWVANLDAIAVAHPACVGCKVHQGFYNAWNDFAPRIDAALKELQGMYGKRDVMVTGHSLGGALSWHAALHLLNAGWTVKSLYNFGSPRVGNTAFAVYADGALSRVKTQVVRVTHHHDPVPHLPPAFLGFQHFAREVFFYQAKGTTYIACADDPTVEARNCAWGVMVPDSIPDHLHYLDMSTQCNMN